jgi:hypothetical protein
MMPPETAGIYLARFANDTGAISVQTVLKNVQRSLPRMESWQERWNIKINERKTGHRRLSHTKTDRGSS